MIERFQGQGQARRAAEEVSRKKREKLFFVVKSLEGGLHYQVVDDQDEINPESKILLKYKNGMIDK